MAVAYNSATNTITVTGGTSAAPLTLADVLAADQAGGWGKVTSPAAGLFVSAAHVYIGDGVTSTNVRIADQSVSFAVDCKMIAQANATLNIYGSRLAFNTPTSGFVLYANYSSGEIYGSIIANLSSRDLDIMGTVSVKSSALCGAYGTKVCRFVIRPTCSLVDCAFMDLASLYIVESPTMVNNRSVRMHFGVYSTETCSISKHVFIACDVDVCLNNTSKTLTLIDSQSPATITSSTASVILERYTLNLKVVDQTGSPVSGAAVTMLDQFGTQVFALTTGADGKIAQQTVTAKQWAGTSEVLTTYSPHRLTISKAGYETQDIRGVTLDAPINWTVEVLDEVFTAQDRTDLQAAKADAAAAKTAALAAQSDAATIKARLPLAGVVPTTEDLAARTLPAADYATAAGQAAIAGGIIGLPAAPSPEAIRQEMEAAGGMLAGAAADAQTARAAAESADGKAGKLLAAVYDSATFDQAAGTITLSNGAVQTFTDAGVTTVEP